MKILLFWDVNLSKNLSKFIPKNVISSSLTLVQSSSTSLRAASHVIEMMASFFKLPLSVPSWHTGRLWLLRLGYYKLTRKKQKAAGWIWIIDHTIQWGIEKCLVIWELRQRDLPVAETILNHEDVEPIAMFPVTSSNGEILYVQQFFDLFFLYIQHPYYEESI